MRMRVHARMSAGACVCVCMRVYVVYASAKRRLGKPKYDSDYNPL